LVWLAIGTARGDYIGLTEEVEAELDRRRASLFERSPPELDSETVRKALVDHDNSPTRAAQALGLKNRHVLLRLMKKHGIDRSKGED
jgi:transcriptional regulator with GAF, ATPase, and Fis domain